MVTYRAPLTGARAVQKYNNKWNKTIKMQSDLIAEFRQVS